MRGRRGSTAETERPAPLEIYGEEEDTRTAVGGHSLARALFAIRRQHRSEEDGEEEEDDEVEGALDALYSAEPPTPRPTLPAPPKSDVREIATATEDPTEDPLERYVDALLEPALEDARRKSGTRVRRETMKMDLRPMRPRQATLPMIDRPQRSSAHMPVEIRTPAMALVPPVRSSPVETPPPRGNKTVLVVAFLAGIVLALGVGAALTVGPFQFQ